MSTVRLRAHAMSHRPGQEGEAWINNQDKAPYVVSIVVCLLCRTKKKNTPSSTRTRRWRLSTASRISMLPLLGPAPPPDYDSNKRNTTPNIMIRGPHAKRRTLARIFGGADGDASDRRLTMSRSLHLASATRVMQF